MPPKHYEEIKFNGVLYFRYYQTDDWQKVVYISKQETKRKRKETPTRVQDTNEITPQAAS